MAVVGVDVDAVRDEPASVYEDEEVRTGFFVWLPSLRERRCSDILGVGGFEALEVGFETLDE